jgi:thioredoxin-related protein
MKSSLITIVLLLNFGFISQIEVSERYHLIIFEGSDWCANCIRLEKNILNDTSFLQYLKYKNIKLMKIDFPQRKKLSNEQKLNNEQIAGKYDFKWVFPTVIISRSDTLFFEKIYYQNQSVKEIEAVIQHKLQILQ